MTTPASALSPELADFPARYARTARFTLGTARNLRVVGGGSRVLFCRSKASDDPVLCLWELDLAGGQERLVVDPAALFDPTASLPPAERARRERARESASGIVAYATDEAGARACFALAGALFVVDVASGAVTAPDVAGSVYDPRLNGPGTAVAYVDGGDLRVVELGGGTDRVLRSHPDPLVSFGRAEFVAAEEMQRQAGYWWAPDGRSLLVARVDENTVPVWWIGDPAHPAREPQAVRYPAAGALNAAVGLELVQLDGSHETIQWSEFGRYEYLADVVWAGDRPPLVVRQTRDQRTVSIAELDPATGALTERRAITDGIWVELVAGAPRWCAAGLLTVEDQGAARRLVLDGTPLTGDDHQIRSLLGLVDRPGGDQAAAVSLTVGDEPGEIQVGLVPLAGPAGGPAGSLELLTTGAGVHGAVVDGATVVLTAAAPEPGPPRITVHRLGGPGSPLPGDPVASITDHGVQAGFAAAPLFCRLGPDQLPSAVFLPSGHDGSSPLPVLLDPYGGPHAQRVLKNHNPHLVSRWFAEHGYAVVVTDGRGTPGRGPAWERAVWGDLAGPVLDDQLAALDAVLERHPFLDAGRVAIRGWSFGGYLAALALLRRPDRFHSAVAGAPVTDWRLYDTHYTERYLGHPAEHPEHYRRSNLWWESDNGDGGGGADGLELAPLTRPLLLIHGLADDNVVAAHTLRFSTALLSRGHPHRVLPLSGVTHMTPQVAVAENLLRLQLAFLDETLAVTPGAGPVG